MRSQIQKTSGQRDLSVGGEQIEGKQAVLELLRVGKRRVHKLTISQDGPMSSAMREIYNHAAASDIVIAEVTKNEFLRKAKTEAPQGVIATAEPIAGVTLNGLAKESLDKKSAPFLVLLDSISDPYNVGSIIRTALAAGIDGVILCEHSAAGITPAAAKAAAGAIEHLSFAKVSRAPSAIGLLKEKGFWVVGLDSHSKTYLDSVEVLSMPLVLVLGSEGKGISPLAKERCDILAAIEMYGPAESLGVSAAAAVALFGVVRARTSKP
ncbi:MAG: 23S rRNA (guanosine(2251)-2'-O)-methyltransferase RlmB [Firmicutes bacterium]|jgi:23S rRNA (guanosine2251-2'-O)-methyltransferase|nr:23S rRNA (guanosine(2251)-2'-O)-methyltransferase RlmB [Bacillota bacterium]